MIARQQSLKALQVVAEQRSTGSLNPQVLNHAHQLFDKSPHPGAAHVNRSMVESLRRKLPFQALDVFSKHFQMGTVANLDEVTVALSLKACSGDPFRGSQIHGFSVISGFFSHITVANSLMNMYCKAGEFSKAVFIFEKLAHPDVVSWNTVLSGFSRSEDALSFACRMNASGIVFDPVTYTTALSFCSRPEEFRFGLQLHTCITKSGLDCETFVGNALISLYCRWERLTEARRIFDEMPSKDLVSWNAIISGYSQGVSACGHERNLELGKQMHGFSIKRGYGKHVSVGNVLISTYSKCDHVGDAALVFKNMNERNVVSWTTMISINEEDAVFLFNEMRLDGVPPNHVTFVGLLHAVTVRDLVGDGKKIHGVCLRTGFSTEPNVCNSLITMYAKFKLMDDSEKVFQELDHREIITWNALISGYAQNGMSQAAIQTFMCAVSEVKPNQYTFGSVLSAIGAAEDVSLRHGKRCHSQIIKLGLNTDPVVSSALLDMYAKRGSMFESERVFSETTQQTQVSWTSMISAYSRHGDYESVMIWFKRMLAAEVEPDSITFLSVLTACGRKGMIDTGRQIFDSMIKDYKIEPSPEHYSCMVDMFGRAGRLEEADEIVKQIPGGPGVSVLQSLLGSCRTYGNVELAEKAKEALLEMEPNESGTYVLMANLFAEKGEWDNMANLKRAMREVGVLKKIGFSWVDVDHAADASLSLHGFSSGDMTHPMAEKIRQTAEFLGLEMKLLRESETESYEYPVTLEFMGMG
ncbi:Pentatricopeptide repeat-containing protein At4g32430, mitochondrial [Linum grandiflorum]